jgi:hypothetical protein
MTHNLPARSTTMMMNDAFAETVLDILASLEFDDGKVMRTSYKRFMRGGWCLVLALGR